MSRITTVIFDMYDTLVGNDTLRWAATFQEIIREQGLDTNVDRLRDAWRNVDLETRTNRGRPGVPFQSYYEAWRRAFARAFDALGLPGDPEAAVNKSLKDLSNRAPFPETVEALGKIQERWRIAVLSNADDCFLLPNLELLGLNFAAVLSSEEAREYKPRPGLFLEMLRRLGVTPQESVYVGDRQFEDVEGAGGVGMNTVWINRSGAVLDPQLPTPDRQISSLLELPGLISGWPPAEDGAR